MNLEWSIEAATTPNVAATRGSSLVVAAPSSSVRYLMFANFESYLRLLHPAYKKTEPASFTHPARWAPVRWSDVAQKNRRTVHSAMEWDQVARASTGISRGFDRPPDIGSLPDVTVHELTETITAFSGAAAPSWFLFPEVSGLKVPRNVPRTVSPSGPAIAFEGTVTDSVRTFQFRKPSYWGSLGLEWMVATEIDLNSTYVGGSAKFIDSILRSLSIEMFRVSESQKITEDADWLNR